MKASLVLCIAASLVFSAAAFAEDHRGGQDGPCEQIVKACTDAGFVKGDAKQGNGLWVDCVKPIMQGTAQPKKAVKPLPAVDSGVVAACKAKHPNFGELKGGRK